MQQNQAQPIYVETLPVGSRAAAPAQAQGMSPAQLAALRQQLAPIYGDPSAAQTRPQLQAPAPAEAAPMPWGQQWQQYLQQQAAYQQQLAQQQHNLGPFGNQLYIARNQPDGFGASQRGDAGVDGGARRRAGLGRAGNRAARAAAAMSLELTRPEAAALLLLVGLGMVVYHAEDESALAETLAMLDRLPTEYLAAVMRKLGAATAAMEGSDAG